MVIEKSEFFEKLFQELDGDPEYETTGAVLSVILAVHSKLDGRPYSWLAKKMGVSRSWVHRFMSGNVKNPCLLTLFKIGKALGIKWEVVPTGHRKGASK